MIIQDSTTLEFLDTGSQQAAAVLDDRRKYNNKELVCPVNKAHMATFEAGLKDGQPVIISGDGERILFQRIINARNRAATMDIINPISVSSIVDLATEDPSDAFQPDHLKFLADLQVSDLPSFVAARIALTAIDGVSAVLLDPAIRKAGKQQVAVPVPVYEVGESATLDFWREVLTRGYLLSNDKQWTSSAWKEDVAGEFAVWCVDNSVEESTLVFWRQTASDFFTFECSQKRREGKVKMQISIPPLDTLIGLFEEHTGAVIRSDQPRLNL